MVRSGGGSPITVFVINISTSMHWKGLWKLFSYHGKVVDAFISEKTSKSGKRFGFMRFSYFVDAQRAIARLNGFVLLRKRIWVKVARKCSSRSCRERETVGVEVASFCESKSLADRIAGMGLGGISVKRIQCNHFLIKIPDDDLFDILKQKDWSYLKEFFIYIVPWLEKLVFSERITWIELYGVPLHCWNYETFKRIIGKWGKLVSLGENWLGVSNYEKVEMLISISQPQKLDEIVLLEVGDVRYSVNIKERGWSEEQMNEKIMGMAVESVSESKSGIGVESEKGAAGIQNDWLEGVKEKVFENVSDGKNCQKVLGEFNEGDNIAVGMGGVLSEDLGAGQINSGLDRAREDVVNMGLALVVGSGGGNSGLVDSEIGLGVSSLDGLHMSGGCYPEANQVSPNLSDIPEKEGRGFFHEVEEEFLNAIRSRRKKKQFNKKSCSMRDI
ncbi:hypothetical protein J1N35_019150 [Gossypium stocksii]|uniref:RRM domain-containing protein n=1 Tax=Gossypium stocksii TaxID=47602 RepID=A0A9D3VSM4_9ROSI|nr:hypothetical protein J1N35_019150 [Gossypium stocksii]